MRERLLNLLIEHSYVPGEVTLASGKKSNFYVDCRKTALLAEGHHLIGALFFDRVRALHPDAKAVGGVVLGACPLASAVSHHSFGTPSPLPAFYLRKESKGHGMGKLLEGPVDTGSPVVILEDVVTTGGSTLRALDAAKAEGLNVIGVIALVDREENDGAAQIAARVPFEALFTKSEILNRAGGQP